MAPVVGLVLGAGIAFGHLAPLTAVDQEQARLNVAAPVPRGAETVGQTFVAAHNGLSSVELLAVVYPDSPASATLTLRLLDAGGATVAQSVFTGLAHNAPLALSFPPLRDSADQTYTLELKGSTDNNTAAWAYSLDGYMHGALLVDGVAIADPQSRGPVMPRDLRFSTSYTYLWADLLRDAMGRLVRLASLLPMLWLILFAPGLLLVQFILPGWSSISAWVRWGLALGLSLGLLALAWLWVSVIGLRWTPASLGAVYGVVGAVVIWRALIGLRIGDFGSLISKWRRSSFRNPQSTISRRSTSVQSPISNHHVGMVLILVLGLIARFLAVRDLALPAWVDSSHHFLIARLLAELGGVPADYAPLLPVASFFYHFGFHALAVTVHWLTPLSLSDTFLWLGQVLNGLAPLAAYAFVGELTGRARAGLWAAFFVAFVSYFPGYYVTWGRYTQLTGILILAPALAAAWRVAGNPSPRGTAAQGMKFASHWVRRAILAGLIASGLLLTHFRVFIFFVIFGLAILAANLRARSAWRPLAVTAAVGGLLSLPWLVRLVITAVAPVMATPTGLGVPAGYNDFPVGYFQSVLEKGWIIAALLALGAGLWVRERGVWVTAVWTAAIFLLLNVAPRTWLVNNNAWAITLFLPGALLLGWGVDRWLTMAWGLLAEPDPLPRARSARRASLAGKGERQATSPLVGESDTLEALRVPAEEVPPTAMKFALYARLTNVVTRRGRGLIGAGMLALAATLAVYAGAQGLRGQVGVLNPATVLATADDRPALDWLAQNTPADAVFLINGWEWLNGIWAGSDAGSWIWPLVGRRTTLPPTDYAYGDRAWQAEVKAFNQSVTQIADFNTPEALALLRSAGVTHVFIGARGGSLKPEMFLVGPHYTLLYSNGAAWVFGVSGD